MLETRLHGAIAAGIFHGRFFNRVLRGSCRCMRTGVRWVAHHAVIAFSAFAFVIAMQPAC